MTARNRDAKVIATVECPVCRAPRGKPCHWVTADHREPRDFDAAKFEPRASPVHTDRRKLWAMIRDGEIK